MTVAQLIAALERMDPSMPVAVNVKDLGTVAGCDGPWLNVVSCAYGTDDDALWKGAVIQIETVTRGV